MKKPLFDIIDKPRFLIVKALIKRLDSDVAFAFRQKLSERISEENKMVLLDLEDVDFVDSSGLAAIIYCFNVTDIRNQLTLCNVGSRVMKLFTLTRIAEMVGIYATREEAIAALNEA